MLSEFNSSFEERRLMGKTHLEDKSFFPQKTINKHLVNREDPPNQKPIVTQADLDNRIMVVMV